MTATAPYPRHCAAPPRAGQPLQGAAARRDMTWIAWAVAGFVCIIALSWRPA